MDPGRVGWGHALGPDHVAKRQSPTRSQHGGNSLKCLSQVRDCQHGLRDHHVRSATEKLPRQGLGGAVQRSQATSGALRSEGGVRLDNRHLPTPGAKPNGVQSHSWPDLDHLSGKPWLDPTLEQFARDRSTWVLVALTELRHPHHVVVVPDQRGTGIAITAAPDSAAVEAPGPRSMMSAPPYRRNRPREPHGSRTRTALGRRARRAGPR